VGEGRRLGWLTLRPDDSEVRRLAASRDLLIVPMPADAAGFELSHGGRCTKSAQQNDEILATLPYQEPLAAPLSPMTSKLIQRSKLGEMRRLLRRNIDLKMYRPRSEGE
jgi:hypothetical protein